MPITFAFNQSLGSCPNASDFLKIAPRIGVSSAQHSFRTRLGIRSGPTDFWELISRSSFRIPLSSMFMCGMLGMLYVGFGVLSLALSLEKTDCYCFDRISAFSSASSHSAPCLFFSGGIPIVSLRFDLI